jgi:hypothetical protein
MMIEPSAGRLLRRLADSLEAAADARQLKAAAWLLRDLAPRIDGHAAAVRQDIADMQEVLRSVGVEGASLQAGVSHGDEQVHLQLQQQLLQLQQTRRNEPALRTLYLAMLERERALLGPPGGNPSLKDPP